MGHQGQSWTIPTHAEPRLGRSSPVRTADGGGDHKARRPLDTSLRSYLLTDRDAADGQGTGGGQLIREPGQSGHFTAGAAARTAGGRRVGKGRPGPDVGYP